MMKDSAYEKWQSLVTGFIVINEQEEGKTLLSLSPGCDMCEMEIPDRNG